MADLDINKIAGQLGKAKDTVGKIGDMPEVKKFVPEGLQKKMGNLGKTLGRAKKIGEGASDIKQKADKMPAGEDKNKKMIQEGLGQLKTLADQRRAARDLDKSKPSPEGGFQAAEGDDPNLDDDSYIAETIGAFQRVIKEEGKLVAIKEGAKLGVKLRKGIKKCSFEAFFVTITLAIVKDLLDYADAFASLGTWGSILNICMTVTLFVIIIGQGTYIKKLMFKRLFWPTIIEYIPIINYFPSYTISIIMIKIKLDKKRRGYERANKDLEQELSRLGKTRIK